MGDYSQQEYVEYYRQKPREVCVSSIRLCRDCEDRIKKNNWLMFNDINIIPILKKVIKGELVKRIIIECLKEDESIS